MRPPRRPWRPIASPRRAAAVASLVAVAGLGAACGGGSQEPTPTPASSLPDDLCATVPEEFREAYALSATDHATSTEGGTSRATCTMDGQAGGQSVDVTLEVTSFPQAGDRSPAQRATAAVAERCEELRSGPLPEVEVQDNRCVATSAVGSAEGGAGAGGHVIDVSRLPEEGALLVVEVEAPGQPTAQVEYDVTGLATSYLSEGLLG